MKPTSANVCRACHQKFRSEKEVRKHLCPQADRKRAREQERGIGHYGSTGSCLRRGEMGTVLVDCTVEGNARSSVESSGPLVIHSTTPFSV